MFSSFFPISPTAFVCADGDPKFAVKQNADSITLTCPDPKHAVFKKEKDLGKSPKIEYKDENSGEYTCKAPSDENDGDKIYVKFRTCDNCVEMDGATIAGMVVGEVLATAMIGWAVYLLASCSRPLSAPAADKKASDRQRLIPHETGGRAGNDLYQGLRPTQKDEYDVLRR
ncbi:T-cell surface glycoprotein CD3 gamma chain [Myripristis murdjan]|uniref:T-cell surface glycoprotein CD3 gamma chain n=1 Tax=Myripristis murdjan TaxID=586833 RepID=UPI00117602DD|nr:T-cell surface glycoprotein CD3 gamma chain-like [Myripristis murdjan]